MFLGLPDALRDLRVDPALAELLAYSLRIRPFSRRKHFQPFPWAAGMARTHPDGIQQREDLRPFIAIGRGGAVRQGHAIPRRQTMDEEGFVQVIMKLT